MAKYDISKFKGSTLNDTVDKIMSHYDLNICNDHTKRVAALCKSLAPSFYVNPLDAEMAGLLHDISGIVPNHERLDYCKMYDINIVEEERHLPLLTHQKISAHIARHQFQISNGNILSAIACHTTLKKNASRLDKLLFIVDKLEWDQNGIPPYKEEIMSLLEESLDLAVYTYMNMMLSDNKLKIVHPDYLDGAKYLERELKN